MDTDKDWRRLAQFAARRRAVLGLTQEELTARGGPSTASLRLIESAQQQSYRDKTLFALDRALGWEPGSHQLVLDGGEPVIRSRGIEGGISLSGSMAKSQPAVETVADDEDAADFADRRRDDRYDVSDVPLDVLLAEIARRARSNNPGANS